MRHRLSPVARACAAFSLALVLTGCGDGSGAVPTAPTPPAPTPTAPPPTAPTPPAPTPPVGGQRTLSSIQLTGTNTVNVGTSSQLSATARWSDGTSEDVTRGATWQSPNPAVATVTSTGLLTGVSAGTVDVSAAFQGQTGRASVQVMAVDNIQSVLVTVTKVTIDGSCDHEDLFESPRDGEFDFQFEVERSGSGVTPIMVLSRQTMTEGDHPLSRFSIRFNRNVTRGEEFLLRFSGTEYDGLLGADPKFNERRRFVSFSYQAGQWMPALTRSIHLAGNSPTCGVTINFTIAS
jgi:Bacterial Ig-like domain (group 2)